MRKNYKLMKKVVAIACAMTLGFSGIPSLASTIESTNTVVENPVKAEAHKVFTKLVKDYEQATKEFKESTKGLVQSGETVEKVYNACIEECDSTLEYLKQSDTEFTDISKIANGYRKITVVLNKVESLAVSAIRVGKKDLCTHSTTYGKALETVELDLEELHEKYINNPYLSEKYYITVDLNGGSYGNTVEKKLEGYKTNKIELATPIKSNDKFEGWLITSGDATISTEAEKYYLTIKNSDCEVKAIWSSIFTPQSTPVITSVPTPVNTLNPTQEPTSVPTLITTQVPASTAVQATQVPTTEPTQVPTTEPTQVPTTEPTQVPTTEPTQVPTTEPVKVTSIPTVKPVETAKVEQSIPPVVVIIATPEPTATVVPTVTPTETPSVVPTGDTPNATPVVTPKPDEVDFKVDFYSVTIGVGESVNVNASAEVNKQKESISYSVANDDIATVSDKGLIKGVAAGSTQITLKFGKYSRNVSVIVKLKPTRISFKKNMKKVISYTLKKGKSKKIMVWFDKGTYSRKITLKSSNKKIATVSSSGVITAKKKGVCRITAKTYNGKVCYAKIKVK